MSQYCEECELVKKEYEQAVEEAGGLEKFKEKIQKQLDEVDIVTSATDW